MSDLTLQMFATMEWPGDAPTSPTVVTPDWTEAT